MEKPHYFVGFLINVDSVIIATDHTEIVKCEVCNKNTLITQSIIEGRKTTVGLMVCQWCVDPSIFSEEDQKIIYSMRK